MVKRLFFRAATVIYRRYLCNTFCISVIYKGLVIVLSVLPNRDPLIQSQSTEIIEQFLRLFMLYVGRGSQNVRNND